MNRARLLRVRLLVAVIALALVACGGCGYHTVAGAHLAPGIQVLAVPSFVNQTHAYHVETLLTNAVVREFNTRTRYQVIPAEAEAAAVLRGTVLSATVAPIAYDSATGRAASGLVTITMKVTLTARDGRVLYSNPNYVFRDQYQISTELASFFEEQGPALDRLSRDFSRTLVSNVLEAF
jgi:hypothetical protein